jgi:O-acetylhomoserine/O-acetylserine sulfhydrylase
VRLESPESARFERGISITNPTVAILEQRVAALEGGFAAIASSSGMAAQFMAIAALAAAGDNIIST